MKKLIAIFAMAAALSANAFWNSNNTPWGNNYNGGYGGYYDDNGIFGYNPYDYWDPRWYFEEMENMMDEFDEGWNDDYYGYGPYNYGPNGYGFAPQGYMMTPYGPAPVPQNMPQNTSQAEQK